MNPDTRSLALNASRLTLQNEQPAPAAESSSRAEQDPQGQQRLQREVDYLSHRVSQESGLSTGQKSLAENKLQRQYELKTGLDWFGRNSFTQRRRKELATFPGGRVISAQYGLSMAMEKGNEKRHLPKLRIENRSNTNYARLRMTQENREKCLELYREITGKDTNPNRLVFVNSKRAAKILVEASHSRRSWLSKVLTGPEKKNPDPRQQIAQLGRGLFAVELNRASHQDVLGQHLKAQGFAVSPYATLTALRGEDLRMKSDPHTDNVEALRQLCDPASSLLTKLRSLPKEHSAWAQCNVVADAIENLRKALIESDIGKEQQNDPLLANCLAALAESAQAVSMFTGETGMLNNAKRVFDEELQAVLSLTHPYSKADFKHIALNHLERQLDSDHRDKLMQLSPSVHLTTSGMGAIDLGVDAARILAKEDKSLAYLRSSQAPTKGESPFYYEVDSLLDIKSAVIDRKSPVLIGTLRGSSPSENAPLDWSVEHVVAATQERLAKRKSGSRPVTLVLDTTLERKGDIAHLTKALGRDIEKGRLRVVMCKSYQKYASQCSSKIMAGSVTLLAAESPETQKAKEYLEKTERGLAWIENEDSQLLTHFLQAGEREYDLVENSIANASFLKRELFAGANGGVSARCRQVEEPFLFLARHNDIAIEERPTFAIRKDAGPVKVRFEPGLHIAENFFRQRDSFAFNDTTVLRIGPFLGFDGDTLRFSIGQESKAELVERFYMLSRTLVPTRRDWSVEDACVNVRALANGALTSAQLAEHRKAPLAARIALIAESEAAGSENPKGYTINKIVALVGHIETLADNLGLEFKDPRERDMLKLLTEELIESQMPGVSQFAKAQVLRLSAILCQDDLQSDEQHLRSEALESIRETVKSTEQARLIFMECCSIPDKAYDELPNYLQQTLVQELFVPLDREVQLAFLKRHLDLPWQRNFAQACAQTLGSDPAVRRLSRSASLGLPPHLRDLQSAR